MAERIPIPLVADQAAKVDAPGICRLDALWFLDSSLRPRILEAVGAWGAGGDSGDYLAQRVLLRAVAGRLRPGDAETLEDAELWITGHGDELSALRRSWRVEVARFDLVALWESIDNAAPHAAFGAQFDAWAGASVEAAEAAVAGWSA